MGHGCATHGVFVSVVTEDAVRSPYQVHHMGGGWMQEGRKFLLIWFGPSGAQEDESRPANSSKTTGHPINSTPTGKSGKKGHDNRVRGAQVPKQFAPLDESRPPGNREIEKTKAST